MSIFVNKETKVIVQGITGSQGSFYAKRNRDYERADAKKKIGQRSTLKVANQRPDAEQHLPTGALRSRAGPAPGRARLSRLSADVGLVSRAGPVTVSCSDGSPGAAAGPAG